MMAGVKQADVTTEVSVFGGSWRKLMMWLFIAGDALLFAGFLTCYAFLRLASPVWPDAGRIFSLGLVTFMTLVLITSGATMAVAVDSARRQDWKRVVRLLLLTMVGGSIFLGSQAYEWAHFIHEGAGLRSNPWGVPNFSASFYVITGFHGFHVLTGILILAMTAYRSATGKSKTEGLELAGMYWAFVDLVWVFIFPLFYLI